MILGISSMVNPYKRKLSNHLQTIILTLMVLLMCLESSTFLKYQTLLSSQTINSNTTNRDIGTNTTPQDIALLIVYYTPLFLLLLMIFWRGAIFLLIPKRYIQGFYQNLQGYHRLNNVDNLHNAVVSKTGGTISTTEVSRHTDRNTERSLEGGLVLNND